MDVFMAFFAKKKGRGGLIFISGKSYCVHFWIFAVVVDDKRMEEPKVQHRQSVEERLAQAYGVTAAKGTDSGVIAAKGADSGVIAGHESELARKNNEG